LNENTYWFENSDAQNRKPFLSRHRDTATGIVSKYLMLMSTTCTCVGTPFNAQMN
jgi:hypothetical protein